eukprot:4125336-Amphidinium_carterae.1
MVVNDAPRPEIELQVTYVAERATLWTCGYQPVRASDSKESQSLLDTHILYDMHTISAALCCYAVCLESFWLQHLVLVLSAQVICATHVARQWKILKKSMFTVHWKEDTVHASASLLLNILSISLACSTCLTHYA